VIRRLSGWEVVGRLQPVLVEFTVSFGLELDSVAEMHLILITNQRNLFIFISLGCVFFKFYLLMFLIFLEYDLIGKITPRCQCMNSFWMFSGLTMIGAENFVLPK